MTYTLGNNRRSERRRRRMPAGGVAFRGLAVGALLTGAMALGPVSSGPLTLRTANGAAAKPAPKRTPGVFPATAVTDVKTGKSFDLAALNSATAGKPVLVWFWAPH